MVQTKCSALKTMLHVIIYPLQNSNKIQFKKLQLLNLCKVLTCCLHSRVPYTDRRPSIYWPELQAK